MRALFASEDDLLRLRFDTRREAEEYGVAVARESGFLTQLSEHLALHHSVTVNVEADGVTRDFTASVAQVFDHGFGSFGVAFLVTDLPKARAAFEGHEEGSRHQEEPEKPEVQEPVLEIPEESPQEPTEEPPEEGDPAPDSKADGEMRGTSPMHRIKALNPRERSILAMKANRTERQILVRDSSPQVLQGLLNNPHIDSEEILQMVRSSHVVAPILQRVAGDSRWNGNQEVIATIARHPKTPSMFATRLLPQLRTSDLRIMAKMSSGLKEMVRKAALREYMRRTGQMV